MTDGTLQLEVHVVVNGPQNYLEFLRRGARALCFTTHLHYTPQANVNIARNIGAQRATSEYLLFLDDDMLIPEANFFLQLRAHIEAHPDVIAGGLYHISRNAAPLEKAYGIIAQSWVLQGEFKQPYNWHLLGGCLYVPKRFLEQLKFNEHISFGGAETEFLWRATEAGVASVLIPAWKITHDLRVSPRALLHKARRQAHTQHKFFRDDYFAERAFLNGHLLEASCNSIRELQRVRQYMTAYTECYLDETKRL